MFEDTMLGLSDNNSQEMFRDSWIELARSNLKSARCLMEGGQYRDSYYHAGLAVEMALKARLMKVRGWNRWPGKCSAEKIEIHNLTVLAKKTGVYDELIRLQNIDPEDPQLSSWMIIKDWKITVRYEARNFPRPLARDMLAAIDKDGFLEWLVR